MEADDGAEVNLSTPRDLWDCRQLTPHTMFVRGPERWEDTPSAAAPTQTHTPVRSPSVDVEGDPAVFIARDTDALTPTARIDADLEVPVIAGPSTSDEAMRRALEKLEWRWSTPPPPGSPEHKRRLLLRLVPETRRRREAAARRRVASGEATAVKRPPTAGS